MDCFPVVVLVTRGFGDLLYHRFHLLPCHRLGLRRTAGGRRGDGRHTAGYCAACRFRRSENRGNDTILPKMLMFRRSLVAATERERLKT